MTTGRPEWAPKGDDAEFAEALSITRYAVVDMEPSSVARVASYLRGLLAREPMASGAGWEHERTVLGSLVNDLELRARWAGEPLGAPMDLRDQGSRSAERAALARAELLDTTIGVMREEREAYGRLRDEMDALGAPTPDGIPAWA